MNPQQTLRWWGVAAAALALASVDPPSLQGQNQDAQSRMSRSGPVPDTDEDGQPRRLPPLPQGMTLAMVRQGDSLFRGKGGCVTCHGAEATGMPAMGSSLTGGLLFIPIEWSAIDSLIKAGIPEPVTRTPIAMPPKGAQSNLTEQESRLIAAYVWAISQVRGEPWPGGHRQHGQSTAMADTAARRPSPSR
jgi:mono/diheme cytochrome c family protein